MKLIIAHLKTVII